MTFSDVGCGTNACWLRFLLYLRIFGSAFFLGSLMKRRTQAMMGQIPDTAPQMSSDFFNICLALLNMYFINIAIKASSSEKVELHLWRRWSIYIKITMILIGVGGGCLAIIFLALAPESDQLPAIGPYGMALVILLVTCALLIDEGLILLITKNRYEEKVREEAERRGGDREYLKPV